jgi:hypothetical protein
METEENIIEPLLEKMEDYGKASIELLKLKSIDKTADIASGLLSRLLSALVILLFIISLNTAIALWLGEILGEEYYGFLLVACFYGLVATVLFFIHPDIKTRINNSIIGKVFN